MDDAGSLIDRIYDAAYERARWTGYLKALSAVTGSASANIIVIDSSAEEAQIVAELSGPPEKHRVYEEHFWRLDEFSLAYRRSGLGPGKVWSSAALVPEARMANSEFYNDFLQELDLFHFSGAILFDEGSVQVSSGVMRSRAQGPAPRDALRLLEALTPHLQRAVLIDRRLRRLEAAQRAAGRVLDGLPFGLILLDGRGRVLGLNAMAEDILAARDGLQLGPQGVSALRPAEEQTLRRTIGEALAGRAGGVTLPRPSSPRPLRILAAPGPRDARLAGFAELRPAAVLFLHDPERRRAPAEDSLRQLYRLTRAEARLAGLLAGGLSLGEAAERLGIAKGTAGAHLRNIFEKTGARRQGDLIALVLAVPTVGRLYSEDA